MLNHHRPMAILLVMVLCAGSGPGGRDHARPLPRDQRQSRTAPSPDAPPNRTKTDATAGSQATSPDPTVIQQLLQLGTRPTDRREAPSKFLDPAASESASDDSPSR